MNWAAGLGAAAGIGIGLYNQRRANRMLQRATGNMVRAAEVPLNFVDYRRTIGRARSEFEGMAGRNAADLADRERDIYGRLDAGYNQAVGNIRSSIGRGREDVARGMEEAQYEVLSSERTGRQAIAGSGANALAAMQGRGGSLQARFAAANDVLGNTASNYLSLASQTGAQRANIAQSGMGLMANLAAQEAGQLGQLDTNQLAGIRQLGAAFAELAQNNALAYDQMGLQAGQAEFASRQEQELLRRQVAQEPFLARAQGQMAQAQGYQSMAGGAFNLGSQIIGGMFGQAGQQGWMNQLANITGGLDRLSGALGDLGSGGPQYGLPASQSVPLYQLPPPVVPDRRYS